MGETHCGAPLSKWKCEWDGKQLGGSGVVYGFIFRTFHWTRSITRVVICIRKLRESLPHRFRSAKPEELTDGKQCKEPISIYYRLFRQFVAEEITKQCKCSQSWNIYTYICASVEYWKRERERFWTVYGFWPICQLSDRL